MVKYHGYSLDYWKDNAEEDYLKTPITVLKYITCLEEHIEQGRYDDCKNEIIQNQKIIILKKDLPNCPKGRKFKLDINGNYFHSMTDEECIDGKLKPYKFTKDEVQSNSEWFSSNGG